MTAPYRRIESAVHSAVVQLYAQGLARARLGDVIADHYARALLLISTIREVIRPYGEIWMGGSSQTEPLGRDFPRDPDLSHALEQLARNSKFLSFHLFDILDNTRRTIDSALSRFCSAPENTRSLYNAVEKHYLALVDGAGKQVPTLVKYLHDSLSPTSSPQFAFAIHTDLVQPSTWSFVPFPVAACERVYEDDPSLRLWGQLPYISAVHPQHLADSLRSNAGQAASAPASAIFSDQLSDAVGIRIPVEDASLMALAFYLWQRTIGLGIMPYYFRGVAWSLPNLKNLQPDRAPRPAFLAVSCSAVDRGLDASDLDVLDAITRGLVSALTICGVELARSTVPMVFIPKLIRHEVGGALDVVIDKSVGASRSLRTILQTSDVDDAKRRAILQDLATTVLNIENELRYQRMLLLDIATYADPDQPYTDAASFHEPQEMWSSVFSEMIVAQAPLMDSVRLTVATDEGKSSLVLGDSDASKKLTKVTWPHALLLRRQRLRQILANLIKNAYNANANTIEILINTIDAPPGYVHIVLRDDGEPYPNEKVRGREGLGLGIKIVRRIIAGLFLGGYSQSRFTEPEIGSSGRNKSFTIVLPLNTVPR